MSVNAYARQLTSAEIAAGEHRAFVGGLWDELGALQFDFVRSRGLAPRHHLLDVGCGALRGGIHFVRFLDPGHYYGIDINASLLEAGRLELSRLGLQVRQANLFANDRFNVNRFQVKFDYALAISVFTHLPMNHIIQCLVEVRKVLAPGAHFYASYFEAPAKAYLEPLAQRPGEITTCYAADPYHYALDELRWMADAAGLEVARVGEWGHPRGQLMLDFSQ